MSFHPLCYAPVTGAVGWFHGERIKSVGTKSAGLRREFAANITDQGKDKTVRSRQGRTCYGKVAMKEKRGWQVSAPDREGFLFRAIIPCGDPGEDPESRPWQ